MGVRVVDVTTDSIPVVVIKTRHEVFFNCRYFQFSRRRDRLLEMLGEIECLRIIGYTFFMVGPFL